MTIQIAQRIQHLAASATLAVADKARALRERGVDVIEFGAGQPDFDTPQHVKDAAAAALAGGDTKYPMPVSGKTPLRQAICAYFQRYCIFAPRPEQVIVTVGAKDALHLAFTCLLEPDDEVLIPVPYWLSYPEQVRLAGGRPVFVRPADLAHGKINAAELSAAITPRSRVLVLNSPANPHGAVYSRSELEALAIVARKHDLLVISDEIYHRLVFTNTPCTSIAALDGMAERTLTVNGASKTYAMTGWRLGFAAGPVPLIDAMTRLQGQTTSGATSFVQTAMVAALTGDQSAVDRMRAAYKERGAAMHAHLTAIPGVQCARPEGAFYCFADVSATFAKLGVRNADEFTAAALDRAHVAVVSGTPFGCPTHVRLSFATSLDKIQGGLERLARLLT
jgi:aspartate aminotransferase